MQRYSQNNITVDDAFVKFGSKSYAIAKLTSVEVRKEITPPSDSYLIVYILGAVCIFPVIGFLASDNPWYERIISSSLFLAIGIGLIWAGRNAKASRHSIIDYHLILNNSGAETIAYTTKSGTEMEALWVAIETSIAECGRR